MSSRPKQAFRSSSTVDVPNLDYTSQPTSFHEAQQDDAIAQLSRPIAGLIFALFQDLRISQEKQKRRFDEFEERTNNRLGKLDQALDDRHTRYTSQVEQVLTQTQKCAADIEKLAQAQDKADVVYTKEERLTSEVDRLDERLNVSENDLKHVKDAIYTCVTRQDLEALLETEIRERMQEAEEKIMRQNTELLEVSKELHRLKDQTRAQKDQTRPLSTRRPRVTSRQAAGKPSRPEAKPEDIHTAETQPLEKPVSKTHYNLRPRSQLSAQDVEKAVAVTALPKTAPIASSKPYQGAGRKGGESKNASKAVRVQKRSAAESDRDNDILDHLSISKRRKRPSPHANLAKICCEAQWTYEKGPEEKSEHEFIAEFLRSSKGRLSSVEEKRLMEVLQGLATQDRHGMHVFTEDTDWSDIWERLWTIKEVPSMYLKKSK